MKEFGEINKADRQPEQGEMITLDERTVAEADRSVRQFGEYLAEMAKMMARMQRRLDEMESRARQVTVRHEDVLRVNGMIRARAEELCGKHGLEDKDSRRILRAAIKKDMLRRWAVKDLHDLPAGAMDGMADKISGWSNIRLIMDRRARQ